LADIAENGLVEAEQAGAMPIARLWASPGGEGLLFDATRDATTATALLEVIARARRLREGGLSVRGWRTRIFRELAQSDQTNLTPYFPMAEQSNSAIVYGNR